MMSQRTAHGTLTEADVVGLDVGMHVALVVGIVQRVQQLQSKTDAIANRQLRVISESTQACVDGAEPSPAAAS